MKKQTKTEATDKAPSSFENYKALIEQSEVKEKFRDMLGDMPSAMSFLHSSVQIVAADRELQKADAQSILNSVSAIASLGLLLDPSFGQAFIGTYKVKDGFVWKTFAQFQIGWKGLVQLAYRSDKIKKVNAVDVRQGEFVKIDRMRDEIEWDWNQDQDARKKLPVIGFLAYFELTNGAEKPFYMTVTEMKNHATTYSKNFREKDGFWSKDFEGMAKKTVLKLLLDKYAPKSIEMSRAIKLDQAIINDLEGTSLNYADNPKNDTAKPNLEANNKAKALQRDIDFIANAKDLDTLEQIFEDLCEVTSPLYEARKKQLLKIKNK